jgi:hypothetical protein
MGELVQLRDYQNQKDIERMRQAMEEGGTRPVIECESIPFKGAGIDGMGLEKEPT